MSTSLKIKIIKGILAVASAMAAPFGALAMGQASLLAAIILSLIAGIAAAHSYIDMLFPGNVIPDTLSLVDSSTDSSGLASGSELPHMEAHDASKVSGSSPAVAPDQTDVKEGSKG